MLKHCCVAAVCLGCGSAMAQVNPPPTWGQNDELSVSLSYQFETAALPPVPGLSVAFPGWTGTEWQVSGAVRHIDDLNQHRGVWGLPQNTTGQEVSGELRVTIDNEERGVEKQVWFQFDRYSGPSHYVEVDWEIDPKFSSSEPVYEVERLGGGWDRVTGTFTITPQPPSEILSFFFFQNPGAGPVAIDNLSIHTHCIIPTPGAASLLILAAVLAGPRRRR